MKIEQINLHSNLEPHSAGVANRVRRLILALISVFILLPTLSQASGLFDFQMKLAENCPLSTSHAADDRQGVYLGVSRLIIKTQHEPWQ